MKRVLMITHVFPPYGTVGGSIRLVKFLKYLSQNQSRWTPTVLTLRDDLDLLLVGRNSAFSLEEVPENTDIVRTNTREFRMPSLFKGLLRNILRKTMLVLAKPADKYILVPDDNLLWSRHLLVAARKLLAQKKYDVIYATAPPFSTLLSAVRLKVETGLPLVLDIKDDWIVPERYSGIKRFRLPLERRMEAKCIQAADQVITVTKKSQDSYQEKYPQVADRINYIPNGCDVDEYLPFWEETIEKFQKFTLVHAGVFSSRRDLSSLFKAIRKLVNNNTNFAQNFKFMIIGRVPTDQWLAIQRCGISEYVHIKEYLPRKEYLEVLMRSHVPVAINYNIKTLIPGKVYEYWGSRNRMLLLDSNDSAAAEIVKGYDLGDIVNHNDEEGIYKSIYQSWLNYQNGIHKQVAVDDLILFDRKNLANMLENVLDKA